MAEEIRTSQLFDQVEVLQQELDAAKAQAAQDAEETKQARAGLLANKTSLQESLGQLQTDLQVRSRCYLPAWHIVVDRQLHGAVLGYMVKELTAVVVEKTSAADSLQMVLTL